MLRPMIISLIERCRTQAEFFGRPFSVYANVLAMWGVCTGGCGDFDHGEKLLQKGLSFAVEIGHLGTVAFVEWLYGCLLMMRGDGEAAARRLQDAIKHMEGSQSLLFLGVGWTWLGYSHCLMGQTKTAVDLTEKGLKMHTDLGIPWWRSVCHCFCSLAHFELGDTGEARRHGELALQFSVDNKERHMQGLSRAWLGRVLVTMDPTQIESQDNRF